MTNEWQGDLGRHNMGCTGAKEAEEARQRLAPNVDIGKMCLEQKQAARLDKALYQGYLDEGLPEDVARQFVCAAIRGRAALGK